MLISGLAGKGEAGHVPGVHPKSFISLFVLLTVSCQTTEPPETFNLNGRKIIGYWHAWRSAEAENFPLEEVPPYVNQVNVAFAFPDTAASKRLVFPHPKETDAEMKSQIRSLQQRGIEVFLSVGGGNHPIELESEKDRDAFATSLIRLVKQYGFNGVDLNLEGPSTILNPGDTDFRNPTTPKIRFFIQAIEEVDNHFEGRLKLSVAPETQFVFGGYSKYGEAFGGYLPILYFLRDRLDLVHVQLYNSGSMFAYTGDPAIPPTTVVEKGTADFVVALTEMMILGFPVANDPAAYFPGFPAEKIVVGLPSTPEKFNSGVLPETEFRQALTRLIRGETYTSHTYTMRKPTGHPGLKGVMTWSLNWDARTEPGRRAYDFVQTAGDVLTELVNPVAP